MTIDREERLDKYQVEAHRLLETFVERYDQVSYSQGFKTEGPKLAADSLESILKRHPIDDERISTVPQGFPVFSFVLPASA